MGVPKPTDNMLFHLTVKNFSFVIAFPFYCYVEVQECMSELDIHFLDNVGGTNPYDVVILHISAYINATERRTKSKTQANS